MGFGRQQGYIAANIRIAAEKAALRFEGFLESKLQALEDAAAFTELSSSTPDTARIILSRLLGRVESLQEAAFYDEGGDLIASIGALGAGNLSSAATFPIADAADPGTRTRLSPVHIDEYSNEPHVIASVPVHDVLGDFRGNLVAELSLRFMWDLIAEVRIEYGGSAFIVDERGLLIAHRDLTRVLAGEDLSSLPLLALFIGSGESEVLVNHGYKGIDGRRVAGICVPIGRTGWAVVTEIPWDRSYRAIYVQLAATAALVLAAALSAIAIGVFLSKRISAPIVRLTEAASRIAGGETNAPIEASGPREVVELSQAFQSMTVQLGAALVELEDRLEETRKAERELRLSNGRMRALIDNSPMAIAMTDREGRVSLWSPAASSLFGWEEAEILGKPLPILGCEEAKASGGEFQCVTKRGQSLWISVAAAPLADAAGQDSGKLYIASDVTERRKDKELLLSSLREKEVLLREIHHRVKNNLQIVSSLLFLQESDSAGDIVTDILSVCRQRIKSMAIIHEQLYTSADLGCIDFSEYVLSLTGYLVDSFGGASPDIAVRTDIVPLSLGIETAVPCGLIVNELMTNALKHAFPPGGRGSILVSIRLGQDGRMRISVRDDGAGMRPKPEPEGRVPLGLKLVGELAKQLRGDFEIKSEGGTEASVSFPLPEERP